MLSAEAREKRNAYLREWRRANRDRVNENQRRWRANNRNKVKQYNSDYWERQAQERA